MNRHTILAALMALAASLLGSFPALAQQSVNVAVPDAAVIAPLTPANNAWRVMNVDSFPRTVEAAVGQCQREARRSESDRLTGSHCDTFRQMLRASECSFVSVRDGQVYRALLGRNQTLEDAAKRTGRADLATRCDVGDGIYLDWYNGQPGVSCFNVGIIIAPLPVSSVEVASAPLPKRPACHYVTQTQQTQSTLGLFLPSVYLPGCDCCGPLYTPSLWISPSDPSTMTTTILVCN